jgi:thermitase
MSTGCRVRILAVAAAVLGATGAGPVLAARAATGAVTPNDPSFSGGINGQEWGETVDQATAAWSLTTGSSAVTIAVIDSGADPTQPDLQPVLVPGWNVLSNSANTADSYGHGTEVSGVAVAGTNNGQGVAAYCWSCRLMPVEVYNTGSGASGANIASGITWAVNHGANVVNVSLAGTTDSSAVDSAVSYALSHNVTVVAAAGDSGSTAKEFPAAVPGVISVAASTQTNSLMSYSEYGSWVDLAAPGMQATTLDNGYYSSVGGTSISAPAVSGIVGLMLSVDPSATPAQIANALFSTADPVSGSNSVAYGRVNAYRAVSALQGGSQTVRAPVNSSPPTASGAAQSGQTLTASTGTWSGSPTSYAYRWQRCDVSGTGCTNLAGASSSTYTLTSADVGYTMAVTVTAANGGGSTAATSAPTGVVAAGTQTSTFNGSLGAGSKSSASFTLKVGSGPDQASLTFPFKCSSLNLTIKGASGAVTDQASGPSVVSLSSSLSAGSYSWTVSGSCKTSYSLTVTSPSP